MNCENLIEMKEMLRSVDPQWDPEKISKEGFFSCVARKERDTDSKEELENCFKIWDPQGSGLIEEKLFRYMMCKMGDTFSNEEIDALTAFGIAPMDFLVLPRVLALALMTPLLTLYANVTGITGGFLVGVFMLGISPASYMQSTIEFLTDRKSVV